MQPLCQISKNLYRKSTPCNNLSTALRQQNKPYRYLPCCVVNRSQKQHYKYSLTFDELHQNALPGIPVPQLIFDLFDKVHHLCPNTSFLFARLIHNPNSQGVGKSRQRFRRKYILQFVETCQTKYRINLQDIFYHKSSIIVQPENSFVFRNAMELKLSLT